MRKLALSLFILAGVVSPLAAAAPMLSAQSIIVNPLPTSVQARVWVDRAPNGGVPTYLPGERITLYTSVDTDAYVYLFNVDPDGVVTQIFPNAYSGAVYLRAGQVRAFPAPGDRFTFDVAGPAGLNRVLVVASLTPLNLSGLGSSYGSLPFPTLQVSGSGQLAQALSIVVNPLPQNEWVSAVAFYNVAQPASYAVPVVPAPVYVEPWPVYRPVVVEPVYPVVEIDPFF